MYAFNDDERDITCDAKIASAVLAAAVLTGTLVGGAATSASATTGWSGNYATLKACNCGEGLLP